MGYRRTRTRMVPKDLDRLVLVVGVNHLDDALLSRLRRPIGRLARKGEVEYDRGCDQQLKRLLMLALHMSLEKFAGGKIEAFDLPPCQAYRRDPSTRTWTSQVFNQAAGSLSCKGAQGSVAPAFNAATSTTKPSLSIEAKRAPTESCEVTSVSTTIALAPKASMARAVSCS
jgi:hypothetical protein